MKQRVCIYARYSSDLQSDASIEDQIRLCTEKAISEGWDIGHSYTDAAISGASLLRPGIQSLMQATMNGEFDILLAEAMDRLSRDQEDIAGLFKRMEFAGVKIITLSEGEISTMHIGLKGTMNAMFLKDLADKTRRGLRGRVEKGKSGGGIAYGYKLVKQFDANGEAIKGDREIDQSKAKIIRRIFHEYAHLNASPKAIAAQLNKEGIPCPSGKSWGQSTINGNRKRGTGILNNELYIGKLIWNRQRFLKDPNTGKRVTRMNPEDQWIKKDVPDLRIVSDDLWNAAKARQASLERKKPELWRTNRPQYLLSGLTKCGACGGGYSKINAQLYGCSTAKNKGAAICSNRKTIRRDVLESAVLDALHTHLMRDDLVEVFCEEYRKHLNTLHKEQNAARKRNMAEKATLEKEKANIIKAIKDGLPAALLKDELENLTRRSEELDRATLDDSGSNEPILHPCMATRYRRAISDLRSSLNQDGMRQEASEHLRGLVEKIVLTPKDGKENLQIDLYGDLAGILNIAMEKKDMMKSGILERLQLLPANDNNEKIGKLSYIDSVGSGGRI